MKNRNNLRVTIIAIIIAVILKLILFALAVFLIKIYKQIEVTDGYNLTHLLCSLIIDISLIIYLYRRLEIKIEWWCNVKISSLILLILISISVFFLSLPFVDLKEYFVRLLSGEFSVYKFSLERILHSNIESITYFIFMVFAVPVAEEIIFRGFLLKLMLRRYSVFVSLIFTSLIFAVVHLRFTGIGYLIIYGLLFSYSFWKTKSLIIPILLHVIINLLSQLTVIQTTKLENKYISIMGISLLLCIMVSIMLLTFFRKDNEKETYNN